MVELSDGACAYEVSGDGPPLVLVHGMTSPSFVWDAVVPELQREHRVLRYDFFGRGESARPRIKYELALYERQLREVVAHVFGGGAPRLTVIGYSWGSAIAASCPSPERVILIAPGALETTAAQSLLSLPILADLSIRMAGRRMLAGELDRSFQDTRHKTRVLAQLDTPGFEHAFLSTLRHVPAVLAEQYARLRVPVDVLWGTRDAKVPIRLAARLRELVPHAKLHPLEGAGHGVLVDHPQLVTATLTRLLAQGPGAVSPSDHGSRG